MPTLHGNFRHDISRMGFEDVLRYIYCKAEGENRRGRSYARGANEDDRDVYRDNSSTMR